MSELATSFHPIANITVGSGPEHMVYDPSNGYIYVANTMSDSVSVIDPASNSVIKNIDVGRLPLYLLYDPSNGYIYVVNYLGGTVSVLNSQRLHQNILSFKESGLPSGHSWSVTVNGMTERATSAEISFFEQNGTYMWQVNAPHGYSAVPGYGVTSLEGFNKTISVNFTPTAGVYAVIFYESGLPSGEHWSVTLNNVTQSSSGNAIVFQETPGVYAFSVSPRGTLFPVPASGSITVAESNLSYDVDFVPATSSLLPNVIIKGVNVSGLTVTIEGNAETSSGFITELLWKWGDGSSSLGPFPQSHTYSKPGKYNVSITAQTSKGAEVTAWTTVDLEGKENSTYAAAVLSVLAISIVAAYLIRSQHGKEERSKKQPRKKKRR
ncbi:MAG: PKD domain-containing protein [Thermoprotei archaeon]